MGECLLNLKDHAAFPFAPDPPQGKTSSEFGKTPDLDVQPFCLALRDNRCLVVSSK